MYCTATAGGVMMEQYSTAPSSRARPFCRRHAHCPAPPACPYAHGPCRLQAEAVLGLTLRRLTSLEAEKLKGEKASLLAT